MPLFLAVNIEHAEMTDSIVLLSLGISFLTRSYCIMIVSEKTFDIRSMASIQKDMSLLHILIVTIIVQDHKEIDQYSSRLED